MNIITRYESFDGITYDTETECLAHEAQLARGNYQGLLDQMVENHDLIIVDTDNNIFPYELDLCSDHRYVWYKILTKRGEELFDEYISHFDCGSIKDWRVGTWYCLEYCDDNYIWATTLEDVQNQFRYSISVLCEAEMNAQNNANNH